LIGLSTQTNQHAKPAAASKTFNFASGMAQRVACVLLLVLAAATHAHATRSLQQRGKTPARQTVTPAACKNKIPSCETGKCTAQGANVVCTQCRNTYVRANSGLHCGELSGAKLLLMIELYSIAYPKNLP
jgi:hypothetical protein